MNVVDMNDSNKKYFLFDLILKINKYITKYLIYKDTKI